jgi:hypothetical protein
MLLFLHRQLVFMEQLMGKKFVLKLPFWERLSGFDLSDGKQPLINLKKNTYCENTHR